MSYVTCHIMSQNTSKPRSGILHRRDVTEHMIVTVNFFTSVMLFDTSKHIKAPHIVFITNLLYGLFVSHKTLVRGLRPVHR